VSANPKVLAADDAEKVGATSAEATTPILIVADAHEKPKPSITDWVSIVPHSSRSDQKCLHPAAR
jgi:hypothetical protein